MSISSNTSSGYPSELSAVAHDIALFWDYENLALPSWVSATEACKAISQVLSKHGRIRERRIYFDFSNKGRQQPLWNAFDSSGFDLVNTPSRNKKETLDKKLIVDVWAFAWDSSSRNDSYTPCVALLTSDGDFAYTVNKLRDRGILCVVIHGNKSAVANVLKESADIVLDFEKDILCRLKDASEKEPRHIPHSKSIEVNQFPSKHTLLDSITLCKVMSHQKGLAGWLSGGLVGVEFGKVVRSEPGANQKRRFREAKSNAVEKNWIEQGRGVLNEPKGDKKVIVKFSRLNSYSSDTHVLDWEDYLRLTEQGEKVAASAEFHKKALEVTCVYIKNVSISTSLQELVSYLEETHECDIGLAQAQPGPPNSNIWFDRLKQQSRQQAERYVERSRKATMTLRGRALEVMKDDFPSTILEGSDDATTTNTKKIVNESPRSAKERTAERKEIGNRKLPASTSKAQESSTYCRFFLKNVARTAKICDLVSYLETASGCSVLRAKGKNGPRWATDYWFAKVELVNSDGAQKLVELSKMSKLVLHGRCIEVFPDKFPKTKLSGDQENLATIFYERKNTNSVGESLPPDIVTLCHEVCKHGNPDDWVLGSDLGTWFKTCIQARKSDPFPTKQRFRQAYRGASEKGLLTVGRKKVYVDGRKGNNVVVVPLDSQNTDADGYSKEIFIRLTSNGMHLGASEAIHKEHEFAASTKESNTCSASTRSDLKPLAFIIKEDAEPSANSGRVIGATREITSDAKSSSEESVLVSPESPSSMSSMEPNTAAAGVASRIMSFLSFR